MSDTVPRMLPAQPSLEHLRKESKRLLAELRARANSAQLADAQLLLARAHGFPSWRALKQEVERRLALQPVARPLGQHRVVLARSWDTGMAEALFYQGILASLAFCQFASVFARSYLGS